MNLGRNLNSWLLLLALAVMVNRVLTPFSVPPLVVHADGYIEVCSWQGVTERILLNANGEQVESQQPTSHCPQCVAASAVTLPELTFVTPAITPARLNALPFNTTAKQAVFVSRPPPSRAPPFA
ncbi:hypothetical protein [Marinospirillum insulare]|uniref:DUF2946 domain-containing protein n=1 Tax=Marinospirillum insulare TaxID=217169 RepID=A0ABQ5ZYB7_9GAMM|nr:hypothetical protein [Marinospirillum insulare]GLR63337.1 hypothetical protein GCM10007878_07720 [Marinospirillum insulare]